MNFLSHHLDDYLTLRRSLGHDLAEAARLLPRFVTYLGDIGAETITLAAAVAWSQQPEARPGTTVWPRRMMAVRGFARYMSGIDPRTEIPPIGAIPFKRKWRLPYIYSKADIIALMDEARASIGQPLRAATYRTLIGLLATTGMRIGEVIRLDRDDVRSPEGIVVVRQSKFGKSRLIPLSASSAEALNAYARVRDEAVGQPIAPSFFISSRGTPLVYPNICQTFRKLSDTAGVGSRSPIRPRIHDMRHTFAVTTLIEWYRTGQDVQAQMPLLSTYLGHREPRYTYWYLSAAPELLALAAGRFEAAQLVEP